MTGKSKATKSPRGTKIATKPKKLTKSQKQAIETENRQKAQQARRQRDRAYKTNVAPNYDPNAPKIGTPAFERLRKKWYKRLAKANKGLDETDENYFNDIEYAGNPDSDYLKQPAARARPYTQGKQLYFALARNYITHARFDTKRERAAWEMHAEGATYREILNMLKRQYGVRKSIYWVFYFVQSIAEKCLKWNQTHREGMLNPANQDVFASDVLIADFGLNSVDSEYGMKFDDSFMLQERFHPDTAPKRRKLK